MGKAVFSPIMDSLAFVRQLLLPKRLFCEWKQISFSQHFYNHGFIFDETLLEKKVQDVQIHLLKELGGLMLIKFSGPESLMNIFVSLEQAYDYF
ncbi:hypothetical protein MERGE_000778 [Pneumocystis wakefieldiae]|uniref:Uncharacterized protein n=1 Tax=Pneumocystis wakefieldiae TaxID=38082 RepID=A0A899G4M7_9ASCO|nr:hypothetical protein MERGE_000778 [Pneumocystis wakefieldiae]